MLGISSNIGSSIKKLKDSPSLTNIIWKVFGEGVMGIMGFLRFELLRCDNFICIQ